MGRRRRASPARSGRAGAGRQGPPVQLRLEHLGDERVDPPERAAEHDQLRIEDVDEAGQPDPQPAADVVERAQRRRASRRPPRASTASTSPPPPPVGRPARRSSAASPTSVSQQPIEPQRQARPVRVDRHVPDLAAVARDSGQRQRRRRSAPPPTPYSPEMNSTSSDADRGATPKLDQRAEVGIVGDGDRDRQRPSARAEPSPERDVAPAEVRGHRDEAVAATDDARRPRRRSRRAARRAAAANAKPAASSARSADDRRRPTCGRSGDRSRVRSRTWPPSPTTAAASESTAISSASTTAPSGRGGRRARVGPGRLRARRAPRRRGRPRPARR